jgi:hypothetical protein
MNKIIKIMDDENKPVIFAEDQFASAIPAGGDKEGKTCVTLKTGQSFFTDWDIMHIKSEIFAQTKMAKDA